MIHIIFTISLLCILFLIYRWYISQHKGVLERFDSQYKRRPIFYPYNSQPKMYKKQDDTETQETNLMNAETTGIDRAVFKNAEKDIKYLGNIEGEPAPYFRISINEPKKYDILDYKDKNLRGLMNFPAYYE
jgi:hypothetical protein